MTDPHEARHARETAESKLADQHARWAGISRVVSRLRELREDNHFSELIAEVWRSTK